MTKTVLFKVKTLSDAGIWTGSANPTEMTSLKGTSFLGCMRFWTEALLRSFGQKVCDCSQTKKDIFKGAPDDVCPVCHSFGCTGLARAFRITMNDENGTLSCNKSSVPFPAPYKDKNKTFYAIPNGWRGTLEFSLSCNRPLSWPKETYWKKEQLAVPPEVTLATFLMLEYGTLGAQDQYGCGLVSMMNREELREQALEALQNLPYGTHQTEEGLADLRDFYFFKGKIDDSSLKAKAKDNMPINTNMNIIRLRRLLRDALRRQPTSAKETQLRHWICGYLKQKESRGCHFGLGIATKGTLYGWGWLPFAGIADIKVTDSDWQGMRKQTITALHKALSGVCTDFTWKEFSGNRGNAEEWKGYVRSLIGQPDQSWRNA